jgi:hypothetical protein
MSNLIPISRTIENQILLNKHDIKKQYKLINSTPIVDSKNPKYIEEITGNLLRVLKIYPIGNDFCLNMIAKAKENENITGKILIDDYSENYYRIALLEKTLYDYFKRCGGRDIRHSLIKQLINPLSTGIVMIRGKNKKGVYYTVGLPPFKLHFKKYDNHNIPTDITLELLKDVYKSLIDESCFKGNDGYDQIPAYLYALCTQTDKGCLQSYNPIYKIQILGARKNTNKKNSVNIFRNELLKDIAPEYINSDGHFKNRDNVTLANFIDTLNSQMKNLVENNKGDLLVGSLNIGFPSANSYSTLYFTNGNDWNYTENNKNRDNKYMAGLILKKLKQKEKV